MKTEQEAESVYIGPQWVHDCTNCQFLGQFGAMDLYHCMQGGKMPTVIARYGHGGHQYISGMEAAEIDNSLAEAKRRAVALGLKVTP